MKLILNNDKEDSLPRKVVIDFIAQTCILDDISTVSLESFFTLDFHHPLLDEPVINPTQHTYTYTYDNFQSLTHAGRFIYSALLRAKNPTQCIFVIKPTLRYQQHKSHYTVPFSMHAKKAAKKTLPLEEFNEIASCFRDYAFHYQDNILLDKTFLFSDLPEEINGEHLYQEDTALIEFCERKDELQNYDIRYIHHLIGLGVFTRKNILKGEQIGLYCGAKITKDPEHLSYTYRGVNDCLKLDIDARHYGNFTRFINHADSACRYDELEPTLSYANVNASAQRINGNYFIIFTAAREIKAGEQLLVDYGGLYFTHLKHKFYIHRNGRIVDIRGKRICRDKLKDKRALLMKMAMYKVPGAKLALLIRPIIAFLCTMTIASVLVNWVK